jgi:hypothetical protein
MWGLLHHGHFRPAQAHAGREHGQKPPGRQGFRPDIRQCDQGQRQEIVGRGGVEVAAAQPDRQASHPGAERVPQEEGRRDGPYEAVHRPRPDPTPGTAVLAPEQREDHEREGQAVIQAGLPG